MPCRRLSIQTCYFPMTVPMSFLLLSPSIRGADCASGACCSQAISFIYDSGVKPSSFIFRNHLRTPRRWRSRSSIKFLRWSSSFGADCVCGPCMRRRADRPTAPRPRPACTRVRSRCRNYFRVKKGARKRRKKGRWNCATHATLTADSERNAVARSFLARFARSLSLSSNRASRRRSFICNLFLSSTFRRIT